MSPFIKFMTIYSHTPRFICLMCWLNRVKCGCNRNKQPYSFQGFDGGPNFLRDVVLLFIFYLGGKSKSLVLPLVSFCRTDLTQKVRKPMGDFDNCRLLAGSSATVGPLSEGVGPNSVCHLINI